MCRSLRVAGSRLALGGSLLLLAWTITLAFGPAAPAGGGRSVRQPIRGGPPPLDLRRVLPGTAQPAGLSARVAALEGAPPQYFNMTTAPRPPAAGKSTASQDLHPDWSADERTLIFASNRANRDGTAAGQRFHLWVVSADGASVTPVTGGGAEAERDQLYPAFAPGQSRIAYAGQPAPGAPLQLFVLDLSTAARLQLTGPGTGSGIGATLADVSRPTWSPGGDRIAFAARLPGAKVANLFLLQVATRAVVPLTQGTDENGIDSVDPAWSPDGRWIAFASTGRAPSTTGSFSRSAEEHDLWLVRPGPPQSRGDLVPVTTGPSDDREPAWSPRATDTPNGLGTGGRALLAFASNRAGSYDIWWLNGLDASGMPTPERAGENPARLLLTNDVSPADGSPLGQSEERYPTWARFLRSANIAYQSDATGNRDLWQAAVMDVVAPALEAVDGDEIVRVTPRLATPGSPVRIEARVRDLQSGVGSVWVQFKDPDGKYQGTGDGEHKLYRQVLRVVEGEPVAVFEEWECEGVSAASGGGAPRYFRYTDVESLKPGANGRPNLPAPSYLPVADDAVAFSGSARPPFDGADEKRPAHWLRLWDDGPPPGGQEPPGATAGDGIFSATWATPIDGSDYYLDVIVYDRAIDPLGRFRGQGNWKLYDNVGGFSTAPFVAAQNVLAVMDHALGQKFLGGRPIASGRGITASFAFNSLGTESYILDQDEQFLPKTAEAISRDRKSIVIGASYNNLGPTSLLGDAYDVWRILARGPLDASTLTSYVPTLDRQPDPNLPQNSRLQLVAERAVLWAAPFAGDVWTGAGSLTDPRTQALLTQFVERGGRLWVTGQDVAWALTADGTTGSPFLRSVLRAAYVADLPSPAWFDPLGGAFQLLAEPPDHPLVIDPRGPLGGFFSEAVPELDPDPLSLADIDVYPILGTNDQVTPLDGSGSASVYTYAGEPGRAHIAWAEDTRGRRVIFSSFGLEQIGRRYVAVDDGAATWNYRGKLTHAGLCWLTHFAIQGRVTDTSGTPLAGVVVRALAQEREGSRLAGTALSTADGTYLIRGLPSRPEGYALQASLSGFLFQHAQAASEHGLGRRVTRDLVMTRVRGAGGS